MRVRGISGEKNGGSGMRMKEESGRGQSSFYALKCRLHVSSPGEGARISRQCISERTENVGGVGKKTAVEVYEPEKPLKILERGRRGIIADSFDMRGQGGDSRGRDGVTEKRESRLGKNTFGQVDQKTVGFENVKNGGEMGKVRGKIGTGHQNVVEIDKHKGKTTEEMIHEPLESLSSIAEAKRHFGEFKKTERSDNGSFGNIGGGDRNLVITLHQVQFGENRGAMETGGEVMEIGKRIAVRNGLKVKAAVVAARPPGAVRLGYEMERRSPRAAGATNDASRLKLGKVSLSLVQAVLI